VGGHGRDPAPRPVLLRHPTPLRQGRAPPSRRSVGGRCRAASRRTASSSTSSPTMPPWRRRVVRAADRRRRLRRDPRPGRHSDPGILPRFRQLTGMQPDLEDRDSGGRRVEAIIEYLWRFPR
jgi:hypothetical protein